MRFALREQHVNNKKKNALGIMRELQIYVTLKESFDFNSTKIGLIYNGAYTVFLSLNNDYLIKIM